jgi:hypothetical protein
MNGDLRIVQNRSWAVFIISIFVSKNRIDLNYKSLRLMVLKLWGAPPGAPLVLGGGRVDWGIYLFWIKYGRKVIYILIGILLGWNILLITQYQYWLLTISSTFCRRLKSEKLNFMSNVYLNLFGCREARRLWNILKGAAGYKILGPSDVGCFTITSGTSPRSISTPLVASLTFVRKVSDTMSGPVCVTLPVISGLPLHSLFSPSFSVSC